jgi:hypothetical protein
MGLLDDAIREHMELKRLRGADPSVLARQEQDALGPVVRERDGVEEVAEGGEDGDGGRGEIAAQDEALGPGDHEQTAGDDTAGDEGILSADGAPGDGDGAGTAPARGPDFASVGQETAELDMRTVLDEQHGVADRAGQVDSAGLGGGPGEDVEPVEDVLEETPDFLRDTPEQERLWFEQQRPRDFDFDG